MKMRGFALLAVLLIAGSAAAGVVFEVDSKDHRDESKPAETVEMAVEGRQLKMQVVSGDQGFTGHAVYNGEREELLIIDHDKKSYMVLDKATMLEMSEKLKGMMAQMEKMLENMPEGQREQVRKMMKDRMPMAMPDLAKTELKKTTNKEEHAGYPCVEYDILREGQKVREVWITDWDNVKGGEEAAVVFEEMAAFFSDMLGSFGGADMAGGFGNDFFAHWKDIKGFPIVTREYEGDTLVSETVLQSATPKKLSAADFEPPAGYTKRAMPQIPGM